MKVLYFDAFCGASGDMIVGALIDAGAPFAAIQEALASLHVEGFHVTAEKVVKHGITATQFGVHIAPHDDDAHGHGHGHGHGHHHHPHRNLHDILHIVDASPLPEPVKEAARATFRRIAECEAQVHGTTIDKIHFHEVGAVDSIVDVVAAHLALHLLGVERVISSPLHVGSGTVKTAHGILPVPAPATALLLQGAPAYGSDVKGELVTPTGAALIVQRAHSFGPMPAMRVGAVGHGSGTYNLPDRANVLRVFVGEMDDALAQSETIAVVEANIDDMNPELYPPLIADLLSRGARDAFLTPITGKKGRPGHLFTVLCDEGRVAELLPALFAGSTTFGVRIRREQRICLEREWKRAATPFGDIRVKIGRLAGAITCMSPEFEDCRGAAERHHVSVRAVYEAAHAAAVKGELSDV